MRTRASDERRANDLRKPADEITSSSTGADESDPAPEGCALLESWDKPPADAPLAMDRAYEGDKTRRLVETLGMTPVVPPKANRKAEWDYEKELCKLRNVVEWLFRRLKGYRRIYTRFDKLDVRFLNFALIFEMISGEA